MVYVVQLLTISLGITFRNWKDYLLHEKLQSRHALQLPFPYSATMTFFASQSITRPFSPHCPTAFIVCFWKICSSVTQDPPVQESCRSLPPCSLFICANNSSGEVAKCWQFLPGHMLAKSRGIAVGLVALGGRICMAAWLPLLSTGCLGTPSFSSRSFPAAWLNMNLDNDPRWMI